MLLSLDYFPRKEKVNRSIHKRNLLLFYIFWLISLTPCSHWLLLCLWSLVRGTLRVRCYLYTHIYVHAYVCVCVCVPVFHTDYKCSLYTHMLKYIYNVDKKCSLYVYYVNYSHGVHKGSVFNCRMSFCSGLVM